MAVSSSYAWELRRDQLITRSLQIAGLLNAGHTASRDQIALGTDLLQMVVTALQNDGIFLHAIERYSQPLSDGVISYVQPADTISVEDGAVVRSTDGNDTQVHLLTPIDFNRRAVKTQTGQPTEYMGEKSINETWTIYLYPVPTSGWPTLIYPRVRKLRDSDSGNVSIDVPVKYLEAVALKLASRFCRHYNRDAKAKALLDEYEEAREMARNDETNRGPMRLMVEPLFWGR
jgi:hypothetical protein